MKISYAKLKKLGACESQRDLFRTLFGSGLVEITLALCQKHAQQFDWNWCASNLLPEDKRADYNAKRAPLLADYNAKRAPLLADYNAKRAPLDADYNAKRAPLRADYDALDAEVLAYILSVMPDCAWDGQQLKGT
jgi:hypothetical protein